MLAYSAWAVDGGETGSNGVEGLAENVWVADQPVISANDNAPFEFEYALAA